MYASHKFTRVPETMKRVNGRQQRRDQLSSRVDIEPRRLYARELAVEVAFLSRRARGFWRRSVLVERGLQASFLALWRPGAHASSAQQAATSSQHTGDSAKNDKRGAGRGRSERPVFVCGRCFSKTVSDEILF